MRKLLLIVLIILTGCSSEQTEIKRQEVIIREFIDIYYNFETFNNYDCTEIELSSVESNIEFIECTQVMLTDIYGDYLSDELIAQAFMLPSNRQISNMLRGHNLEIIDYELQVPDNLDFPNIFQLIVTEKSMGFTYKYVVNIEVDGDTIIRYSGHSLGRR